MKILTSRKYKFLMEDFQTLETRVEKLEEKLNKVSKQAACFHTDTHATKTYYIGYEPVYNLVCIRCDLVIKTLTLAEYHKHQSSYHAEQLHKLEESKS